jgi:hypothetical protein
MAARLVPVNRPRALRGTVAYHPTERRQSAFAPSARAWVHDALAADRVEPLGLTAEIAADAAPLRFAANPADQRAQLVTRDERIRAFDSELAVR